MELRLSCSVSRIFIITAIRRWPWNFWKPVSVKGVKTYDITIGPSVDDVRHLPGVPFHILHRGVKIHETTALRQTGEAVFQAIPDFLSHGDVL